VVVNRAHERFYTPLLADLRTRLVVAQPENRGTAPAILYALLVLAARQAAADAVVFYPSDHFVSDDAAFSGQIEEAFVRTARRPDLVTLLGKPGEQVAGVLSQRQVRRFWEKPAMADAERFRAQSWLWNSFVMVGRVSTMLALIRLRRPICIVPSPRSRGRSAPSGRRPRSSGCTAGCPRSTSRGRC